MQHVSHKVAVSCQMSTLNSNLNLIAHFLEFRHGFQKDVRIRLIWLHLGIHHETVNQSEWVLAQEAIYAKIGALIQQSPGLGYCFGSNK